MPRGASARGATVTRARALAGRGAARGAATTRRAGRSEAIVARAAMARALSNAERLQPRVDACNEITAADHAKYVPFVVDGHAVGALQPWFADELLSASGSGTLERDASGTVGFRAGVGYPG